VAYGGTFNGNPTSVAAANATRDFLREHRDLYGMTNTRGDRIRREVPDRATAARHLAAGLRHGLALRVPLC
jgi:glutamate-1-semialdehyde aminotransferase